MRRWTWAGALAAGLACAVGAAPAATADEYGDYAAIRGDWQPDRVVTACRFTVEQLENARTVLTGEDNYSGLQGAIEAEMVRQRTGGCPGGGGVEGAPVVSRVRYFRGALRFGLSRRATVRIVVQRRRPGRWATVRTLTRTNRRAGNHAVPLPRLARGAYRTTVTAFAGGRRSAPRRGTFAIRG